MGDVSQFSPLSPLFLDRERERERDGYEGNDLHVKGPREELRADARARVIDRAAGALGGLAAARRRHGNGRVGLLVAVGAGDDDLELASVVAEIGRRGSFDPGSPERALVIRDAGR